MGKLTFEFVDNRVHCSAEKVNLKNCFFALSMLIRDAIKHGATESEILAFVEVGLNKELYDDISRRYIGENVTITHDLADLLDKYK